ncbi:MAG: hypothetical protein WA376_06345 [Terrimicrobiaceae bacterium]
MPRSKTRKAERQSGKRKLFPFRQQQRAFVSSVGASAQPIEAIHCVICRNGKLIGLPCQFLSYRFALTGERGHRRALGSGRLICTIRQLVRPKAAERFFSIRPLGRDAEEKIVSIVCCGYLRGLDEEPLLVRVLTTTTMYCSSGV